MVKFTEQTVDCQFLIKGIITDYEKKDENIFLLFHRAVNILLFHRRYRNFRTFASPRPSQFSCLALEGSGEIVAAGSVNSFEIFVWSMQTGRLLEVGLYHIVY